MRGPRVRRPARHYAAKPLMLGSGKQWEEGNGCRGENGPVRHFASSHGDNFMAMLTPAEHIKEVV